MRTGSGSVIKIGLMTPQSGPIGLYGPSSIDCAKLAVEEINAGGGLFGSRLELVFGDGGARPERVVADTSHMIEEHRIRAMIGSHVSPNRDALVSAIGGRIPYVYTTLYEGDQYSFGVFMCGETPVQQLDPLIVWLRSNRDARKWFIVANDYSFPLKSCRIAKDYIAQADGEIVGEEYLPLYTEDYHATLRRIERSRADAVLIYLVGMDAIVFNRQFSSVGLHRKIARAAPVLCENTLLGIGCDAVDNMYSTAGFTNHLQTNSGGRFRDSYRRRFGPGAPVPNRFGVSCYEGLHLLKALAEQAGSLDLYKMQAFADGLAISTPRGDCRMQSNHLGAPIHLVEARGYDLCALEDVGYRTATSRSIQITSPVVMGNA
ncbi:substrate-binding domain-containing protein [Rhodopseudomonas sp. HC1]|uniref:substrate-binding domain-containing protein n=1 Tax=Rhodopseudomonas infernalis TaxID=2897386 RepID=UPI001EE86C66|nr:substrate-binding domain-containing protein [Rhodopseudomonas infernalis]MCG6205203.1 substrate-binding domain-containing protein [Rhodopseudomonas infernalis]